MTAGSLTDLDPPAAREPRWPFYVVWVMGGLVVGGVLLSHLPGGHRGSESLAGPVATDAPAAVPTTAPGPPRIVQPFGSPLRVGVPLPIAPARP